MLSSTNRARILVIEDDADICELLSAVFSREGWELEWAGDGENGLESIRKNPPDCVILDLMLPGIDGLEVLRRSKAKEKTAHVPFVITSAKGEDSDIIAGLELGADDYVVKPYSPKVLTARVRAVLRRRFEIVKADSSQGSEADTPIERGPFKIDTARHEAFCNGESIVLSATEFSLLAFLIRSPGWVFTRDQIINAVKGHDYAVTERSVDVQIVALRKKLGAAGDYIETVRGVGYRFKE